MKMRGVEIENAGVYNRGGAFPNERLFFTNKLSGYFRKSERFMNRFRLILFLTFLPVSVLFAAEPGKRFYVERFDPANHPDRGRYAVTPPDWSVFGNETKFICCRGIDIVTDPKTGKRLGVNFDKTYEPFANAELGTILWPHQTGIQIDNLDELARWVKGNGLL